jgi:hypothetical protein
MEPPLGTHVARHPIYPIGPQPSIYTMSMPSMLQRTKPLLLVHPCHERPYMYPSTHLIHPLLPLTASSVPCQPRPCRIALVALHHMKGMCLSLKCTSNKCQLGAQQVPTASLQCWHAMHHLHASKRCQVQFKYNMWHACIWIQTYFLVYCIAYEVRADEREQT